MGYYAGDFASDSGHSAPGVHRKNLDRRRLTYLRTRQSSDRKQSWGNFTLNYGLIQGRC